MGKKSKDAIEEHGPVGGIAFFVSLVVLYILTIANLSILPALLTEQSFFRWRLFIVGAIVGAACARYFIRGRISVFLHELKHSVLSNLAGNRAKGMRIDEESGHFEYSYTKRTAHMNALIALAPYFLPVLFFPFLGVSYALAWNYPGIVLICSGLGYGADLILNFKDASPHQSDFYNIRGGYKIGFAYVIGMNCALFTFIAAWVSAGQTWLGSWFFEMLKNGAAIRAAIL